MMAIRKILGVSARIGNQTIYKLFRLVDVVFEGLMPEQGVEAGSGSDQVNPLPQQ